MHPKTFFSGLVSGLIASFLLEKVLYGIWPERYVPGWNTLPSYTEPICYALTLSAIVIAGAIAAEWSQRPKARERIAESAKAGLVAALIFYVLVGVGWLGILNYEILLQLKPVNYEEAASHILFEAFIQASWRPIVFFWAVAAAGSLIGAIGGLFTLFGKYDPCVPTRPHPTENVSAFVVSLWWIVAVSLVFPIELGMQTRMQHISDNLNSKYQWRESFAGAPILIAWGPIVTLFLALLISGTLSWKVLLQNWHHQHKSTWWAVRCAATFICLAPVMSAYYFTRNWLYVTGLGLYLALMITIAALLLPVSEEHAATRKAGLSNWLTFTLWSTLLVIAVLDASFIAFSTGMGGGIAYVIHVDDGTSIGMSELRTYFRAAYALNQLTLRFYLPILAIISFVVGGLLVGISALFAPPPSPPPPDASLEAPPPNP